MSPLDPAARAELERLFAVESPQKLRRLAEALDGLAAGTGGAEAARFAAHSLRGAAATVDRDDLVGLCTSIEEMLEEEAPDLDEVRAASRLVRAAGELEERVDERTASLELARQEADRASSAKTAFLSHLSHELRTPLNAIRGFSQLLRSDPLSVDQAEAADHIAAGAEHMTRLIEELLDTARIEAGEFRVELEPLMLGEAVLEVVELSRGLAADHDVSLSAVDGNPGLGVLADRVRFRQTLLNLVTNAIVYNRRGGTVSIRTSRSPNGRVLVDVLDTGAGIASEQIDRVFVPYDRLGRGAESGGLGLGLALSKKLVEAMDGSLRVESEPGFGSRFTIELGEVAVTPGVAASALQASGSRPALRRVLYIEDNATSMKLVELLLRGRGVDFQGRSTAAEGIAAALADPPDLILLDLQLPDGSGEDVLRTLRASASLRAVPIVILSAQASRETVRRLLEAGADDYLTKPLEVDRAADVIERFLRRDQ